MECAAQSECDALPGGLQCRCDDGSNNCQTKHCKPKICTDVKDCGFNQQCACAPQPGSPDTTPDTCDHKVCLPNPQCEHQVKCDGLPGDLHLQCRCHDGDNPETCKKYCLAKHCNDAPTDCGSNQQCTCPPQPGSLSSPSASCTEKVCMPMLGCEDQSKCDGQPGLECRCKDGQSGTCDKYCLPKQCTDDTASTDCGPDLHCVCPGETVSGTTTCNMHKVCLPPPPNDYTGGKVSYPKFECLKSKCIIREYWATLAPPGGYTNQWVLDRGQIWWLCIKLNLHAHFY